MAWFGVPPVTRREQSQDAFRTLPVETPFFARWKDRRKYIELSAKPSELPKGAIDQRTWQRYQSFISRVLPVARADFYRRLMTTRGLKSIRALAKVTGEDWSRVARVLTLLELPIPAEPSGALDL